MKKLSFIIHFVSGASLEFSIPEAQGKKLIERLKQEWSTTTIDLDDMCGINFKHVTHFKVSEVL